MNLKSALSKVKFPKDELAKRKVAVAVMVFLVMPLLLALALFLGTRQPNTKYVPPEQPEQAETQKKTEDDVPTIEEAITAAIRAHERATKVCYDEKIEGFLIHYPYQKPDENGQQYFNGWYYLKWHQMWKTQNGIWFMKDFDANEYLKVYPDVTGLNCKNA